MQTSLQPALIDRPADLSGSRFALAFATTANDIEEAQQLRWKIFAGEMGASLRGEAGVDRDVFDGFCDHLIVRDLQTDLIVGTYRILSPEKAQRVGHYYSETEFDLSSLRPLRSRMVEVGRSCVHADYRTGAVINLLWSGIARYMQAGGYDYLIGCASVSMADGGKTAAHVFRHLARQSMSPAEYRVTPYHRLPIESLEVTNCVDFSLPPLVKGYTRLGAWLCGDPAWDPDFNTADLLMLLPLEKIQPRYLRWLFER